MSDKCQSYWGEVVSVVTERPRGLHNLIGVTYDTCTRIYTNADSGWVHIMSVKRIIFVCLTTIDQTLVASIN